MIHSVQLLINFNSKRLQYYRSLNLLQLKGKYQSVIHLLIILTKLKITKFNQSTKKIEGSNSYVEYNNYNYSYSVNTAFGSAEFF